MNAKTILAGALGTTLLATAAFAQTPAAPATSGSTMSKSSSASDTQHMGQWRASKLVGLNVYNQNNEKLGDINELLVDKQGKIEGVVLGVGGFLGMGEHDIVVSFDKLEWVITPVSSNTAMNKTTTPAGSSTSTTTPATTTTGAATTSTTSSGDRWYPDHAMFNATKDQLKSMPEFKYSSK